MRLKVKENDVVRGILEYLAVKHICAFRVNNMGVWDGNRFRKSPNTTKGVSDILAVVPPEGRLLAIECKSKTGRVSEDQSLFMQRVIASGGEAVVARSIGDVVTALDEMGGVK